MTQQLKNNNQILAFEGVLAFIVSDIFLHVKVSSQHLWGRLSFCGRQMSLQFASRPLPWLIPSWLLVSSALRMCSPSLAWQPLRYSKQPSFFLLRLSYSGLTVSPLQRKSHTTPIYNQDLNHRNLPAQWTGYGVSVPSRIGSSLSFCRPTVNFLFLLSPLAPYQNLDTWSLFITQIWAWLARRNHWHSRSKSGRI